MFFHQGLEGSDAIVVVVAAGDVEIDGSDATAVHHDAPGAIAEFARPLVKLIEVACCQVGRLLKACCAGGAGRWMEPPTQVGEPFDVRMEGHGCARLQTPPAPRRLSF
jgi:hypothetical protein